MCYENLRYSRKENIQNYNLKEKRCLTLYYLYVEYSLNLEEIDHYGGFDKILNSFKFYDTFETFTYYICSSVCSYNKMILNKNKLK